MIVQHPSFDYIPDDTVLWQYMSLVKFPYLIKFRQLHLHRIDDLMDKEEGELSELDKKALPFYSNTKEWNDYLENDRKRVFISCWIKHPIEISQMWYSYGKDGVAIRTTAGAIRRAMEIDNKHIVRMIGVRYLDRKKEPVQTPGTEINWLYFSTSKRKAFEMEKEVRLLFNDYDREYNEKGIDFDITLNDLIEEIKVASTVPKYIYKLICREVEDVGIKVIPVMSNI